MNAALQAQNYMESFGWMITPVAPRDKRPVLNDWPNRRLRVEELSEYFVGETNLGAVLGEPSHWLIDVDLDMPIAVRIAPLLLPPTVIFGRKSKPRSHFLFSAPYTRTEKFQDCNGNMIVELRSTGCQTVIPRSVHPSGELIEWDADADHEHPTETKAGDLRQCVARIAAAVLLTQCGWMPELAVECVKEPARWSHELEAVPDKAYERIARWLGLPARQVRTPLRAVPALPDRDRIMKRAREYMQHVPGAVSGSGGHQQTWQGAITCIRGFDLTESEAREILREYNQRCDPPWSDRELEHKLAGIMAADRVGRGWLLEGDRKPPTSTPSKAPGSPAGNAAPLGKAEQPPVSRIRLIELGEALTPELIALQQEPLPTGIAAIDEQLGGGYFPGELIVLQASTGVGKTSFNLLTQCSGVVSDPQRSGLYVTTEMQAHELQARRACQVLNENGVKCNWRDILKGVVPLERTREATANTRIHVLPARPGADAAEVIRAAALELAERYGKPPLIVADFLQGLAMSSTVDRRLAVGNTAYALQGIAAELRTPTVAISSISRAGNSKDKRDSDDPYEFLNISKESGDIEYAASVVAHLDVKAESDERGWRAARFILAKTRFGNLGIVGLRFHGASGRFEADVISNLSKHDIEVMQTIHSGTFASANAVAKAINKNRPKVLDAVRKLQRLGVATTVAGYLEIPVKFRSVMTDQFGEDLSADDS